MEEKTYANRRHNLLELMNQLAQDSKDCRSCSGVCCTFVGNSMRVTPLEAWDLYLFLSQNGRWTKTLETKLNDTIMQFRLDKPLPGDGRRSFGRRRYTCPFYKDQNLGCSIDPQYKPYGCLGFNPIGSAVKDGENCRSYVEELEVREGLLGQETQENKELIDRYEFDWEKLSIPEALLDLSRIYPFSVTY